MEILIGLLIFFFKLNSDMEPKKTLEMVQLLLGSQVHLSNNMIQLIRLFTFQS